MTRPLNALVLGVGGNVSQSILKALALAPTPTRTIVACISPSSMGLYTADRAYLSPAARDPEFVPWLLEVCRSEQIDIVMSGSEIVLEELSGQCQALRQQTGAVCVVSSPQVLRTGRDKLLTGRWLEAQGLPCPPYAPVDDADAVKRLVAAHGFPLIAKPRLGKGSDGVLTVRDQTDLDRIVFAEDLSLREVVDGPVEPGDLLLQKYLGRDDDEYTVGCFCDREGQVRGTIALRRTLQAGTTVAAQLGDFPKVREVAGHIVTALAPAGPCNVQLRLHDGQPVPFEINPRFSGTTALRARLGFNEVEAALRHFALDEPVAPLSAAGDAVALRYWSEIYVSPGAQAELLSSGHLDAPRSELLALEDWPHQ